MKKGKIDKIFFGIVIALVLMGLITFTSASLGILDKSEVKFNGVIFSQFIFGFLCGFVALYVGFKVPYKLLKRHSLVLFVLSIIITGLVLVPGIGQSHGTGAHRWIDIFGFSFQPVEFLKIGFIIYLAAWLSWAKEKVKNPLFSIVPLFIMLGVIALVLVKQPDTKSIILMVITGTTMLFVSGVPLKYIFGILGISIIAFVILVSFKPYLKDRINTFLHPSENSRTSSYQLQQCLIAVGSGGVLGRGLGQSIQKFFYLPESQGDSIFCVIGEELGFVGSFVLICLYLAFAMRGYRIALRNAPDSFGKLLIIGFITIITTQSFMNTAAMIGVFPMTGVPLVFFSQGGTAMMLSLGMIGIILNISQFQSRPILERE